jgi:hypothetical protein
MIKNTCAALALISATLAVAQPVPVPKTNPMQVFAHYMPWFNSPITLGANNWGYHWTMNNRNPNVVLPDGRRQIASHWYPLVGPYDSQDPDLIEYHLLLMKLSGIDGLTIDWYGSAGSNGDINSLLANSNAIINRAADFGLKFAVVLEDRFARSTADVTTNVAYLRNNYFNRPNYIRTGPGNDPLMMVFGPITQQTPANWQTILPAAGEDVDLRAIWYQSSEMGAQADGEFPWIFEDEAASDHLARQTAYYQTRTTQIGRAAGVAYPGFDDFYAEGGAGPGIGFTIPHNTGQTFTDTLNLANANASKIDMLQLATWNDFGEGTMIEPTREFGFNRLFRLQQYTGTPYSEVQLSIVRNLFDARKSTSGHVPSRLQLDAASNSLNRLQFSSASNAIRLANATAQIDRLFAQPAGNVTNASRSFDFNGDGRINPTLNAAGSDADHWVRVIQQTQYGDASLDRAVNFTDLLVVAQNYNSTSRFFGWVDGSFNGDGVVNFADLLLVAQNYAGGSSRFASDWEIAQSTVPEPGSLLVVGGMVVLLRRRRQ